MPSSFFFLTGSLTCGFSWLFILFFAWLCSSLWPIYFIFFSSVKQSCLNYPPSYRLHLQHLSLSFLLDCLSWPWHRTWASLPSLFVNIVNIFNKKQTWKQWNNAWLLIQLRSQSFQNLECHSYNQWQGITTIYKWHSYNLLRCFTRAYNSSP